MNIFSLSLLAAGVASATECGKCNVDVQVCNACKAEAKPCPPACTTACSPCAAKIPATKVAAPICKQVPTEKLAWYKRLMFRKPKTAEVCSEGGVVTSVSQPAATQQYNACTGSCSVATAAPIKVVQPVVAAQVKPAPACGSCTVVKPVVVAAPKPVTTCTTVCKTKQPCNLCSGTISH